LTDEELAQPVDNKNILAKFALLRWDELDELAFWLSKNRDLSNREIDCDRLAKALARVCDQRWRPLGEYIKFTTDQGFGRRDFGKLNYWKIAEKSDLEGMAPQWLSDDRGFLLYAANEASEISLPRREISRSGPAEVLIKSVDAASPDSF
jgi:hypothetical protein